MLATIVDGLTPSQKRRACRAAGSIMNNLTTLPESLGDDLGGGDVYLANMEWADVAGLDVAADADGFTA
jgi:hypothetical protein